MDSGVWGPQGDLGGQGGDLWTIVNPVADPGQSLFIVLAGVISNSRSSKLNRHSGTNSVLPQFSVATLAGVWISFGECVVYPTECRVSAGYGMRLARHDGSER